MEIMDSIVDPLAKAHIAVILHNVMNRADWYCNERNGNGLSCDAEYP